MSTIDCTSIRLASVLTVALVMAVVGCRENAESPTAPEPGPALTTTATAALVFRQVSAGETNNCVVSTDSLAYCAGVNSFGQIGDGTTTGRFTLVAVAGGLRFRHVSVGYNHTCGVTAHDRAYCWGYNGFGQLGDGVGGGLRFSQMNAGEHHTCGVTTDDRAYCWGMNFWGQLGDGTMEVHEKPVAVAGERRFRQVTAGGKHSCGVTRSNRAFCWGDNYDGQLGDGTGYPTVLQRLKPVAVAGDLQFDHLTAGGDHTCGATMDFRAYCWGANAEGQIGDGTRTRRLTPVAVAGGFLFSQLSADGEQSAGLTTGGRVYKWGRGSTTLTPLTE